MTRVNQSDLLVHGIVVRSTNAVTIGACSNGGYLAENAEDLFVAHLIVFVDVRSLLNKTVLANIKALLGQYVLEGQDWPRDRMLPWRKQSYNNALIKDVVVGIA